MQSQEQEPSLETARSKPGSSKAAIGLFDLSVRFYLFANLFSGERKQCVFSQEALLPAGLSAPRR